MRKGMTLSYEEIILFRSRIVIGDFVEEGVYKLDGEDKPRFGAGFQVPLRKIDPLTAQKIVVPRAPTIANLAEHSGWLDKLYGLSEELQRSDLREYALRYTRVGVLTVYYRKVIDPLREKLKSGKLVGAEILFYCVPYQVERVDPVTGEVSFVNPRKLRLPGQVLAAIPRDPWRDGERRYHLSEEELKKIAPYACWLIPRRALFHRDIPLERNSIEMELSLIHI